MIAVDTSSFIAFLDEAEAAAKDVGFIIQALLDEKLVIPPVVVSELLSDKHLSEEKKSAILELPALPIKPGYWRRVGEARAELLSHKKKAKLADSMIAVFCLDYGIPLIERDSDYRHFAKYFGLVLKSSES